MHDPKRGTPHDLTLATAPSRGRLGKCQDFSASGRGWRGQELQHREGTSRRGHAGAVDADRAGGRKHVSLLLLLLLSFALPQFSIFYSIVSIWLDQARALPRLSDPTKTRADCGRMPRLPADRSLTSCVGGTGG
jgi:hypothetical protein